MDDCRKAIRHLADAVRTLTEALGNNISDDNRLIISATLREAGDAIGNSTIASEYDELELELEAKQKAGEGKASKGEEPDRQTP